MSSANHKYPEHSPEFSYTSADKHPPVQFFKYSFCPPDFTENHSSMYSKLYSASVTFLIDDDDAPLLVVFRLEHLETPFSILTKSEATCTNVF